MGSNWLDSVIRISSSKTGVSGNGTGFAIHSDGPTMYVVTCAHVVRAVGGPDAVLVDDIRAEVIACGPEEDIDLAILRVEKLQDKKPLFLCAFTKGYKIIIPGFYSPKISGKPVIEYRPLSGILTKQGAAGTDVSRLIDVWYLKVTDDDQLEPGYSGSPVIDEANGTVVGIASIRYNAQIGAKQGRAISVEALRKIWPEMPSSVFKSEPVQETTSYLDYRHPGLLTELETIIGELGVETSEVKQFYDASVPADLLNTGKWLLREDSRVSLLAQMLERLDDAPIPENGVSPILKFVEQLSFHIKDPQGKLRKWVDNIGRHIWKVSTQEIATLRQKLQEETSCTSAVSESSSPSVFIKLEPKYGGKQKSFYVRAWLRYGQGEEEIASLPFSEGALLSEKFYTSNTISALLDRLLEDIAQFSKVESEVKKKLRIEFFIPYELIDLEVDHWRFDDGVARLGIRYPVVIRPLERLYEKEYNQRLWKDKWASIPLHTRGEESVYWMSDHAECNGLYAHLIKSHIVCLGMTVVPPFIVTPRNKRDKKLLFLIIIKTGTSIALWPRQLPADPEKRRDVQNKLRLLLSNHRRLAELPDAVLLQRQDAWGSVPGDEHHLGHHLTLLWDDPTRLLPEVPKLTETRMRK